MTIAEILKAKGIGDDIIAAVQEEMKNNKIFTASEENLDVRFGKLKTDHEGVTKQLGEAQSLIEELKKTNKGNEGLQQKITDYEGQVAQLQKELSDAKIEAAMDRKLIAEGANASDLDYLKFQWRKKGELSLDEHGEIKNGDDAVAGLKTQCPVQFGNGGEGGKGGFVPVENKGLPQGGQNPTITKEDFNKMGYNARVELKQNSPEVYSQMMKG